MKNFQRFNESATEPNTQEILTKAKELHRLVNIKEAISYLNEHDIDDYFGMTDMEVIILYLEEKIKGE